MQMTEAQNSVHSRTARSSRSATIAWRSRGLPTCGILINWLATPAKRELGESVSNKKGDAWLVLELDNLEKGHRELLSLFVLERGKKLVLKKTIGKRHRC